ncbi:GNAT family N-acetyltransferase [Aliiruegeria lutimaris]|uniref:Acetyltransferase involved in cellulose biosynthesis, CelD/BcsL family n=1 Tax=Aliiruegeria lutimaris TaxID=571298 RepID=A0A1G9PYB0_9RHOB|nr:GNAT family N-acetyltransferase [Aliiruegeria lutimaris]SDM03075.1 Acetyltransferase involved in cellulose biosynthesis, CelD/BcsL family [Aliiruegeria lutimaris]
MHIETITTRDLDPDLVEKWRVLQSQSEDLASPFFSPEFALAVGRCRNDLHVGLIREGSDIIGLIPFHRRGCGRGVPVGGKLCDYQGIIGIAPPSALMGDLLRGLGLSAFDFNHALSAQPLFAENGYFSSTSPGVDLRAGYDRWKEEVNARTKALKTLARKERKLAREAGPLRFQVHDPSPEAWSGFQRWKRNALKRLGVQFLADGWDKALLEDLRQQQEPSFQGRLSTLYAGDRMVAAHFGITTPRAWHWWFPSYDPDLGNLSAGLVLMRHCIEAAALEGMAELDFGRGSERYKIEFSNQARALSEGSLERVTHPLGALRWLRKTAQRPTRKFLDDRQVDLLRRAGNRALRAGRL